MADGPCLSVKPNRQALPAALRHPSRSAGALHNFRHHRRAIFGESDVAWEWQGTRVEDWVNSNQPEEQTRVKLKTSTFGRKTEIHFVQQSLNRLETHQEHSHV